MKILVGKDTFKIPSCENCIYYAFVGYKRCQLKPFWGDDGELRFPHISEYVDYCGQGHWWVDGYKKPLSFIDVCCLLKEMNINQATAILEQLIVSVNHLRLSIPCLITPNLMPK